MPCTYDRCLYLSDLYHRLAIFHNLIGAVYYHKSQYGLGIQHFRRGVELLIKEERHLHQADGISDQIPPGDDDDLAIKCTEMECKMEELKSKHDRMLGSSINNRRHPAAPLSTQMKVKVIVGREPILIDGRGNFHFLKTDGTSSIPSSTTTNDTESSSQLSPSIVSSVIIHNLALCHSSIGNYSTARELIQLSRETVLIAPIVIVVADVRADPAPIIPPSSNNLPLRPPTLHDVGSVSNERLFCSDTLLGQCLNQLERRLTEESVANVRTEVTERIADNAAAAA